MLKKLFKRKEKKMGGQCETPAGTTKCWGTLRVHASTGNDLHLHDDANNVRFNWKSKADSVSGIESFRRVWKEVFLLVRCLMEDGDEFAFRGELCTGSKARKDGVFVLRKSGTKFEQRLDAYDCARKYTYEVSSDDVLDGITESLDRMP